jgi:hypothetical protein
MKGQFRQPIVSTLPHHTESPSEGQIPNDEKRLRYEEAHTTILPTSTSQYKLGDNPPSPTQHEERRLWYEEAHTTILPVNTSWYRLVSGLPLPAQRLFLTLLHRAQDPEPEAPSTSSQYVAGMQLPPFANWRWLSISALTSALGLLLIACGFADSRNGGTGLRFFIYPGLLLIFTPTAVGLITPSTSRNNRIVTLCILGIFCYLVKIISSPLHFYMYDEFLHWRASEDLAISGHLFTPNSLLPVSPYYPGLEIVTNALSTLSGLDIFNSGLILIGVARLLMVLAYFALSECIFRSARMASIATLLYMTNPHFLFFDSQFAYESLAIPLAILVIFVMAPHQSIAVQLISLQIPVTTDHRKLKYDIYSITLIACLILITLMVTHHVTDFFLDGQLILWTIIYGLLRLTPIHRSHLAWTALVAFILSLAWVSLKGNTVVSYLFSSSENVQSTPGKHFIANIGYLPMLWENKIANISIVIIVLCLPLGLFCLWQRYRSHALLCTMGIISLLYPASQFLRTTDFGIQLADRAAALLFIAVCPVLAIFITQFWPTRRLNWKNSSLLACAISVVFLGGYILSGGSGFGSPPGPYLVGDDSRSIEPEGIQAAIWAYSYLGPNNRIGTDRTNQILMGTYGDQYVVTMIADDVDIAPVFFSSHLGSYELAILKKARLHYLLVDLRLAQSLPGVGIYYEKLEPDAYDHSTPMSLEALTKFNTIPQMDRVFDSGDIVIYNTKGLGYAQ